MDPPQASENSGSPGIARVWLIDGSPPVFSDTHKLQAAHRNLFVMRTRYEACVDPAVPRGSATIAGERPDDALFVEAEWYVEFRDGMARYLAQPDLVAEGTRVVLQGLIEGKWFNRLLDTEAWQPASLGNNLIAAGPGISTTVGELERGARGSTRVTYRYERDGAERTQTHTTAAADIRGHDVTGLLRAVLRACRELGQAIDGIDLGALGPRAATVNSRRRLLGSLLGIGPLPLPNPRNFSPHRAKERLVRQALAEGFSVPPGNPVTIVTRDGANTIVGEGTLVWHRA